MQRVISVAIKGPISLLRTHVLVLRENYAMGQSLAPGLAMGIHHLGRKRDNPGDDWPEEKS